MSTVSPRRLESVGAVLDALLVQGAHQPTQADLAAAVGLSQRTVASAIGDLRARDLVTSAPVRLGPAWGAVLGVSLGRESCRAGLVDANGELLVEAEAAPERDQVKLEPARLLDRVAAVCNQVWSRAGIELTERPPLIGIAAAWPAPVRGSMRPAGTIMHRGWLEPTAPTLPEAIAKALGAPVSRTHVLNDANAHALAVAFDRARDHAHEPASPSWRVALLLRIGGDVGASTLLQAPHSPGRSSFIDSVLVGGARTLGGEIGHLPVESAVVDLLNARSRWVDGLAPLSMDWPCPCGGSGHLASLASGTAWERRMRESDVSLPALLDGVRRGERSLTDRALAETVDPRGIYALEDIGRLIARALAAPVLLLDPHSLTLSGSFAVQAVRDGMIAERETWRHVFGDALSIDFAGSPDRVKYMGVRGAALAVLRRHVYRRFLELLTEPTPTRGLEFTL